MLRVKHRRRAQWRQRKRRSNRLSFESLEPRVLLATVNWAVDDNGFWDVGSNWSTGFAPQPGDDVVLDRPAGDFTITHRSGTTNVSSITSEERLVASGGVLDVSGTIQISNDFVLSGATVKNASVLAGSGGEGVIVTSSSENRLSGVTLEGDLDLSANSLDAAHQQRFDAQRHDHAQRVGREVEFRYDPDH